ncbi:MAG TPA: protein kinase [Polyangiaceae bacterium]
MPVETRLEGSEHLALAPTEQPPASDPVFEIGALVDDTYEIRDVLGEGGMGRVYDAFDVRLQRRVAIKVPWPGVDRAILRREAQALAQIRHPCAIAVHGLHENGGIEFLVMERIFGVSLEQHLERFRQSKETFTIDEALDLLIAIVEGLVAIHRSGLSHRDIKPSNVMIAPANRVVLMDFGLALPEVHAGLPGEDVAGSPAYMAPESIRSLVQQGKAHLVDLYAIGVMAFEMLAGVPPFDGQTVREVLEAHLTQDPPSLRDRRPDVPGALVGLVTRLLAKDGKDRPESAEVLLAELLAIRSRREGVAVRQPFSILIADDDDLVREMIHATLSRAIPDAKLALADSGAAAIRHVRTNPPDVLVLDLQMPEVSGLEVCMFLRGTHLADRVRIVLVSADADERDVALLKQLGVTHYLPKSKTLPRELVNVVSALRARYNSR